MRLPTFYARGSAKRVEKLGSPTILVGHNPEQQVRT